MSDDDLTSIYHDAQVKALKDLETTLEQAHVAALRAVAARPEARTQELSDERLTKMVRIYHDWATDREMVEAFGYSLELYVERMRRAWRETRDG